MLECGFRNLALLLIALIVIQEYLNAFLPLCHLLRHVLHPGRFWCDRLLSVKMVSECVGCPNGCDCGGGNPISYSLSFKCFLSIHSQECLKAAAYVFGLSLPALKDCHMLYRVMVAGYVGTSNSYI